MLERTRQTLRRKFTRPVWQNRPADEPWRRFQNALAVLLAVLAIGSFGYLLLGVSAFDALYQTVTTITTVGFAEIGLDPDHSTVYRAFTLVLTVVGVATVLYTVGVLADSLIEGSINNEFRRRRMFRDIKDLEGHTIIAGWGQVGHAVAAYIRRSGGQVVVIDRAPNEIEAPFPIVQGEATEDSILEAAGLMKAATLILALDHDADNLFVCLSARSLRPDLFIVARTSTLKNEGKFHQAGADRVINPHQIGGSRMAALSRRPHVAEFLDEVLHDDQHDVAAEEVEVVDGSPMIGRDLRDLRMADGRRSLVIAIRDSDGTYHTNPAPDTKLEAGHIIIALGSESELEALRQSI